MRTIACNFLLASYLLIFSSNLGFAEYEIECGGATTPREITNCATDELNKANKELFALWSLVKEQVEKFEGFQLNVKAYKKALLASQRTWLKFRKAHCDWAAYEYQDGAAGMMVKALCLASVTRERIQYFKDYLTQPQKTPLPR